MPKNESDDENDSCVLVGTPLIDLFPEDAKFSVKPKRPEEQIVTDEKGRQRFHGAFTGGFSAGYFNTVGSKEGWAPASFKSSRSDKSDKKSSYSRPEDFMDEEDFDDHGIAPRNLTIKSDYKDQFNKKDAALAPKHNTSAFILEDLIKPVQNTIGVRMLRKMGWREGQGIGPKIKRKLRKLKSKLNHEPGRKIYGVALPSESDESENEELEDDYLVSTFDVNDFQFEIKEDLFGLGYKRLDVGNLFGQSSSSGLVEESPAASLLFPMAGLKDKKNKKGFSGQAFGVGEFEDEDDIDVYRQDNMDMYDFELNSSRQKDTKKLLNKSYGFAAFEDDISILKKYSTSKTKLQPSKIFPAPQVPTGFNLMHKLARKSRFDQEEPSKPMGKFDSMSNYLKSVSARAELLGEDYIQPESVLDLVSKTDRDFLKEQKSKIKDPEREKELKAKRYESFVSFMKKNQKDAYNLLDTKDLTEWEKEKEREEFTNRYEESLRKLELIKKDNLKFVSTATLNENNQEIEMRKEQKPNEEIQEVKSIFDKEEQTDMHKAAMDKKFGQMTRVEYQWKPHPTVCKRFNVPNPFTDTKEYGTVKTEADRKKTTKFSLFNVLTAESRFDKEKSKSLFDEINADMPLKQGPSMVKTVNLGSTREETSSIEFEKKNLDESTKKSEFATEIAKPIDKIEIKESLEPLTDNVYLQERPSVDLFKAIFEDENEEIEEEVEEQDQDEESIEKQEEEHSKELNLEPKTTIISSSIGNIDLEKVNKYLDKEPEKEIPEPVKFTQLIKSLASKKEKTSSSDSSSSSNSSSVEEMVYEEVSISKPKKAKKEKKSKKKKKHKKKSKKSKKNI